MMSCAAVSGAAFPTLAQHCTVSSAVVVVGGGGGGQFSLKRRSDCCTAKSSRCRVPRRVRAVSVAAGSFPEWIPPEASEVEEPACISMLKTYEKVPVKVSSMLEPVSTAVAVSKGDNSANSPLILLAGFDSSALEWRRLFPKLCSAEGPSLECHALDLIGWGFTGFVGVADSDSVNVYSPEGKSMHLKSYIDNYLKRPPILVGASLGGASCLYFAKLYPESVAGLVLIDAQANPEPLQQMPGFLSEFGTSVLKSWPLRSLANNLSYFDKPRYATDDAIRIGRLHTFLSGWKDTILKFMESGGYSPVDLENDIPRTIPVLSLYGEDDKILPRETFELLAQQCRNRVFREVRVSQCGHVPHLEQADATAKAISEFVSEVSSAQASDLSRT